MRSESGRGTDPCVFPHNYRELNDLMDAKSAAANNPTTESAPRNTTSDADPQQTPEESRMIGNFDGSASEFWKLFKDEAKSHDDARIYALKEDMESALIFVRSYSVHAYHGLVMLIRGPTGRFILRCLTEFVIDSKRLTGQTRR